MLILNIRSKNHFNHSSMGKPNLKSYSRISNKKPTATCHKSKIHSLLLVRSPFPIHQ